MTDASTSDASTPSEKRNVQSLFRENREILVFKQEIFTFVHFYAGM